MTRLKSNLAVFAVINLVNFSLAAQTFAETLPCERMFSNNLQTQSINFCNTSPTDAKLLDAFKERNTAFQNALYNQILLHNNFGGIKVNFPDGKTKIVYRSAYLAGSPLCLESLSHANVTTIVNLYSGHLGFAPQLQPLEQEIARANGISNYIKIKKFYYSSSNTTDLNHQLIEIIKSIHSANGNVLIHCDAGEHDTGLVFAILNKCYNQQSLKSIEQNTYCHIQDNGNYSRDAYKKIMIAVNNFPCQLLDK